MDHLQNEVTRLADLIDSAPQEVIAGARELVGASPQSEPRVAAARAGLLIDAGKVGRDRDAVAEGITTIEELLAGSIHPSHVAELHYNLANGLLTQSDLTPGYGTPDWYTQTRDARAQARKLLTIVGHSDAGTSEVRTQALTNLGNTLDQAYRYVEAYDSYRDALDAQPDFGMAALNAAVCLDHAQERGLAGVHTQQRVDELLAVAEAARDEVHRIGGEAALERLDYCLENLTPPDKRLQQVPVHDLGPEAAWVAQHHLALVPGVESFLPELVRWDALHLYDYVEPIDASHHTPTAFTMFNAMKQSFMLARQLAFQARQSPFEQDTAQYADLLDYSLWGPGPARLITSHRLAMDILDQVAVAIDAELATGFPPHKIHFHSYFEHETTAPSIRSELDAGNVALTALGDIAVDLTTSGALAVHRETRNAATHRFVAVHDQPFSGRTRASEAIERFELDTFRNLVVRGLQLSRAALMHYTEFVGYRSARYQRGGEVPAVPIILPPHHFVRDLEDPRPRGH